MPDPSLDEVNDRIAYHGEMSRAMTAERTVLVAHYAAL
jgi:hypothetical protein